MPKLTFIGGPADGRQHDIDDKIEIVTIPASNGGAFVYRRGSLVTVDGACLNYLASPDWDSQQILDHLLRKLTEVGKWRVVGAEALHEMCHTTAPRNSFTDVVDKLDALLHP